MSRILKEKGAALIKGVEAGARTGMMGMMWGGQQVQTLLEETASLSRHYHRNDILTAGPLTLMSLMGLSDGRS